MSGIINPPTVTVIEKKENDKTNTIIYRPVCSFPREIKIIFSLLNKYLTKVLDKEFYGCSYAFRAVKRKYELQHLNAVIDIQQYRKNHSGLPLWRKRSIPTHLERHNPPTIIAKMGLKRA